MNENLPVATIQQFSQIIEQSIKEKNKRVIFGLGKGGIGKTESIEALAHKLNLGYVDIRLLLYTETDLKGIPYPDETHQFTIWLQNKILPTVENNGKKGILVLDEITSAPRSVRTAIYQLINERRLGEYVLPDEWYIVCLGNGEEDGGDFNGMEANFANRCSMFKVVSNLEDWKQWAHTNGVNTFVLGYVSWRPGDLHTFNPNEDDGKMLFASPRSWKAVSDILNNNGFNKDDVLTNLRLLSNVGTEVGNKFIAFCKYKENAVEPADILAGKNLTTEISSNEVLFMTMQGVIRLLSDAVKIDKQNTDTVTPATLVKIGNGLRWMINLPKVEHKVMAVKDLVATDRQLMTKVFLNPSFNQLCPELNAFAKEHGAIFKS